MNAEELKQLKPGDEIFIRARYKKTYADGDVSFLHSNTNVYDVEIEMESFTHPRNVILPSELQPTPKYDPCRLFKKGDKVRPVERHGRPVPACGYVTTGEIYEVLEDEDDGEVTLRVNGKIECISWYWLELVTPVEELEPYFVFEDATSWQVKRENKLCCRFGKATHPHAKEAAEAECARLNAEHRKAQE